MAEMMKKTVHIIPVGFTKPTLLESMKNYKFNRVYLVLGSEKTKTEEKAGELADEIERDIKGTAEVRRVKVDLDDIYASAAKIIELIKNEMKEGSEVKINISGSMRTTAIACYLAASICGADVYIGLPKYSGDDVVGITKIVDVPLFPIKEVEGERLAIIKFLLEKKAISSIDELISIISPEIFSKRGSKAYLKERSRISYHLKMLEENSFIKTAKKGKKKVLELTELGYLYALGKS